MFKTIAIVVVVLIAGILIFAATKPDTFHIQRATNIKAPPEKIFALIHDFHSWGSWSPYERLDPTMKRTFTGTANGRGTVYEWDGNRNVGKGRVEITDTAPPSKVTIKLDMVKPFEAHNIVGFKLEANGDSTNVTWAMDGRTPYIAKVLHIFFSMDRMVGRQFEEGLANLKTIAEK